MPILEVCLQEVRIEAKSMDALPQGECAEGEAQRTQELQHCQHLLRANAAETGSVMGPAAEELRVGWKRSTVKHSYKWTRIIAGVNAGPMRADWVGVSMYINNCVTGQVSSALCLSFLSVKHPMHRKYQIKAVFIISLSFTLYHIQGVGSHWKGIRQVSWSDLCLGQMAWAGCALSLPWVSSSLGHHEPLTEFPSSCLQG